jgi:2-polyprenyl-3-methyl-5-hydroxy-6-metoxy-1,4-benzoquinol methylase
MAQYIDYLESISNPATFRRKCKWLEHNFGALFSSGQQVLEIGPGRGEFLHFAAAKGISGIDVIDRDQGVLEYVKSRYPTRNAWACSAEDISALDNDLASYDRIFVLQVMEHIRTDSLEEFIRSLFKHLNPGGKLIITVPNGANPLSIVERYSDITHHNLFSENSLRELVQLSGVSGAKTHVQGYRIPPVSPIDIVRIVLQKALHLCLKGLLVVNGGVFFSIYDPNITLIVERVE